MNEQPAIVPVPPGYVVGIRGDGGVKERPVAALVAHPDPVRTGVYVAAYIDQDGFLRPVVGVTRGYVRAA